MVKKKGNNMTELPTIKMYKDGKHCICLISKKPAKEADGWSDSESPAPKKETKKKTSNKKWSDDK